MNTKYPKRIWLIIQGQLELNDNNREVLVRDEVIAATFELDVAKNFEKVLHEAAKKDDEGTIIKGIVTPLVKEDGSEQLDSILSMIDFK